MEEGREKATTSKDGDDDAAAKKGNGFLVVARPAPSSLRGRHAQGGDILIPASTNWCESGDRRGTALIVKKESRFGFKQSIG